MIRIILVLVVLAFALVVGVKNSKAQEFEINAGSVNTREGKIYFDYQEIQFSGPKLYCIIKFGKRPIEILNHKKPDEVERAMNRVASPSEEQENQLTINNSAYIASLRTAFVEEPGLGEPGLGEPGLGTACAKARSIPLS